MICGHQPLAGFAVQKFGKISLLLVRLFLYSINIFQLLQMKISDHSSKKDSNRISEEERRIAGFPQIVMMSESLARIETQMTFVLLVVVRND